MQGTRHRTEMHDIRQYFKKFIKIASTTPLKKSWMARLAAHILFLSLVSCVLCLPAQTHILVRSAGQHQGSTTLDVKWYSQAIVQERSIYLFRKEASEKDWKLLTPEPLKVQTSIPAAAKAQDKELATFEEIIKGRKQKPIQGILMIALWIKSIQSEPFAQYLGIYFRDTTASLGKKYQYSLRYSTNPYDNPIVVSAQIEASDKESLLAPVTDFKALAGKKTVGFLWKPENLRFWGVNLYRRRSDEAQFKLLTKQPLIINEYQSADPKLQREFLATDDSLKEGGLYFYRLHPVDFFGREGYASPEVPVFIKDKSSPEPVVLRKDSAYKQQVWLHWTKSPAKDLKGYQLYRSLKNEEAYEKINKDLIPPASVSYVDNPKEAGDYYYFITAQDTAGNESPSNKVIANLDDVTPPQKPSGLQAKADTGKIRLIWKANTEKDLWGYYVYRGLSRQAKSAMVLLTKKPVKLPQYTDTINKVASNTFNYMVAAVDTNFNISETSDTAGATLPDLIAPDKPYVKHVQINNEMVEVTWAAGHEADLSGFQLHLSTEPPSNPPTYTLKAGPAQRNLSFANPYKGAHTFKLHMTATDLHSNVSAASEPFVLYAHNANTKPEPLGKLKLSGSYKKKQKTVELKWKYEGKAESKRYILFEKNKAGEYKPITKFMSESHLRLYALEKGTHTYEIRMYLAEGKVLKSEELQIKYEE